MLLLLLLVATFARRIEIITLTPFCDTVVSTSLPAPIALLVPIACEISGNSKHKHRTRESIRIRAQRDGRRSD